MFKAKQGEIKIYTDGANLDSIIKLANDDLIDGITTNPTLMRGAGVINYMNFAAAAVSAARGKSISLEVFADNHNEMIKQAKILSSLGTNVKVKIPIVNSKGISSISVIEELLNMNIQINITAVLTRVQIEECLMIHNTNNDIYISIFAGRIADTGKDPTLIFKEFKKKIKKNNKKNISLLWASTREVFNVYQAIDCGCDIITLTPELISKLRLKDYDLTKFSLETVQMFKRDSDLADYFIE